MTSRWLKGALGLACVLILGAGTELSAFDNDEATGYRMQNYRAPVNLPVQGGRRVEIGEVDALIKAGAVLVDVMPQRGGYDPETGAWRIVDKRETIPGAVWLPNTGTGHLEARLASYFAGSLSRLTNGEKSRPLVFFCKADCWMSWNAVKRAADLGYSRVSWYADGTDGWTDADRVLVEVVPAPVPSLAGQ
ncbi:MAG: rhodanese-like domain-containing protein [Microvirga sp.]